MAVTLHEKMNQVLVQLDGVLLGKQHGIRLALACVMSRGHLLLEDLPGMGKTTLAHGLARVLGLEDQRLQFTADMLPADIIGVSVYRADSGSFEFHPGPVFCQLLLADEINRATPKTQSALLEAMAEQQVSSDGHSYPLQKPFFVIATQNPVTQYGTFPLPESQLDRFAMRLSLGYPAAEVVSGACCNRMALVMRWLDSSRCWCRRSCCAFRRSAIRSMLPTASSAICSVWFRPPVNARNLALVYLRAARWRCCG